LFRQRALVWTASIGVVVLIGIWVAASLISPTHRQRPTTPVTGSFAFECRLDATVTTFDPAVCWT
jgi:hypothetical protein